MSLYPATLKEVARQVEQLLRQVRGIKSDSVKVRKFDWTDIPRTAGVTVRYEGSVRESDGTNNRDDFGYPAHVTVVWESSETLDRATEAVESLKTLITRWFNNQRRMDEVVAKHPDSTQLACTVMPGPRLPSTASSASKEIFIITVMCWFREPRTAQTP